MESAAEHLRPHPAAVNVQTNLKIKKLFASRTDKYTYAFNSRSYVDFDIYNVFKEPTVDRSHVCELISTSDKPVVFFLCYDVGYNTTLKVFIRHIVCCVAFPSTHVVKILFFDMRNLCDISPKHQTLIEDEISSRCKKPVDLINAACISKECVYLQKFKGEHEIGWCVAWALFFLENAISKPLFRGKYLADMTEEQYVKHIGNMYKKIHTAMKRSKTNHFIERWYVSHFGEE